MAPKISVETRVSILPEFSGRRSSRTLPRATTISGVLVPEKLPLMAAIMPVGCWRVRLYRYMVVVGLGLGLGFCEEKKRVLRENE